MIFKYVFEDGTILRLLDFGLSSEEIRKLEELHGKCAPVGCDGGYGIRKVRNE